MKKFLSVLLLCLLALNFAPPVQASAPETAEVMILEVSDEINDGMRDYLIRNFQMAEKNSAAAIILLMDTPGGQVSSAGDIKRAMYDCEVPIITLVEHQALSAGSYLALASDKIAMMPGSTIGDAEVRIGSEKADEKYISAWREEFAAMAELNGRDPQIARAFVDSDIEIPGIIDKDKLLVLTANRAYELGFCDYLVDSQEDLLEALDLSEAQLTYGQYTTSERIARVLTSTTVAPVLLSVGVICLFIEFLTPGTGIFLILGMIALGLYFGGSVLAGMATWIAVLLFVVGVILCLIELLMPGFGVFGIGGLIAIVASIFLSTPDIYTAVKYTAIMLIALVILLPIFFKFAKKRKFFDKLMVKNELTTEEGYVSRNPKLNEYVNAKGKALSVLRPAGTMLTDGGERLDVVTKGDFIEQGERIQVVGIEGTWLIVQKIDEIETKEENE